MLNDAVCSDAREHRRVAKMKISAELDVGGNRCCYPR